MYECATTFNLPSQSPAVTAPPEGEPRHVPTEAALERPCLSLRERWQCRKALTERAKPFTFHFSLFAFRRLAPAGGFFFRKRSKNRAQVLGLVGAISSNLFTLAAPTPLAASLESRGCFCGKRGMRFAHRANPLDIAPCPAQARIFGYFHCTCIGANLPLPLGEVAARSADGEGKSFFCFT